jgi:predicted peptidase
MTSKGDVMRMTVGMTVMVLFPLACLAAGDSPFVEKETTLNAGKYKNEKFRYLVLEPEKIEPGKKYPVILFLHGAGERGDNPHDAEAHFPKLMATPEYRRKYECFVVVPQCREKDQWVKVNWSDRNSSHFPAEPSPMMQMAMQALDQTIEEYPVDKNRIYLTGLSMGGYGSWDLSMRRPEMFAAVVPICGGGDEREAKRIINVPIWAFHGSVDPAVPVERSRSMIEALKEAGGSPKYTEYKGVGHDSWTPAYTDPNGVMPWMFEQVKK